VIVKLYYVPMTRAGRARWMLEELEVPYELHRLEVSAKENRQPAYQALNPLGQVPTLVDGDVVIYESLAICLYLADKYLEKGMAPPPSSPLRGPYYQWSVFSMVTVEKAVDQVNQHTVRLPEAQRVPAMAEAGRARFRDVAAVVDAALGDRELLVGDRFNAADLMMAAVLGWGKLFGLLAGFPRLEAYVRRHVGRPAAKRSRAD
jgi:glutathione S-transferase